MGTHYEGTRKERRALDVFIKLMRAADAVRGRLAPVIARFDLTGPQFGVLETLLHLGPMNHAALASKRLVTKGNMTSLIDNLERDGLVRRSKSARDGRERIVSLTPKGHRLVTRVFPEQLVSIVAEFDALSAREQEELARLCKKLGRQLS